MATDPGLLPSIGSRAVVMMVDLVNLAATNSQVSKPGHGAIGCHWMPLGNWELISSKIGIQRSSLGKHIEKRWDMMMGYNGI